MSAQNPSPVTLPGRQPGLRLAMLRGFHATLCRSDQAARVEDHRSAAACFRALGVVDRAAGDLDVVLVDLQERTVDLERSIARGDARRAALEEVLGIRPPAIAGEVVR